ncbi:MAG TPA: enolase C-terminal domain-like protein [Polyangiaceae bacterium]|nr:enolase C-terminal domain-like protein [Polyangiaceae bacterium]
MEARIERLRVAAHAIPTDAPESDGTFAWQRTVLVTVELTSGKTKGFGYTYADAATAKLIEASLAPVVLGRDAYAPNAAYCAMLRAVRNLGRDGIAAMAISAVDIAVWDLKARLLGLPLVELLSRVRDSVGIYGSGGFTSYDMARLEQQLGDWAEQGIPAVKMKVGTHADRDVERVQQVRDAIGDDCELFVDANGAYSHKQALALAEHFADSGVTWFEEPVSSDDLPALSRLVQRMPASLEVAAGEYGYEPLYFERMLAARAVDVLQADATRCGGVTGFLRAAVLCDVHQTPLSCHCAPALHVHLGCATGAVRHLEYFHDHVRIERLLLDGFIEPRGGKLQPDRTRAGMGLELRHADARRFLQSEASCER